MGERQTDHRPVESRVFATNLDAWLVDHSGDWVIIERDVLIGFYPSATVAYSAAATLLNSRDFFLRQVHARYQKTRRATLVPPRG